MYNTEPIPATAINIYEHITVPYIDIPKIYPINLIIVLCTPFKPSSNVPCSYLH